MEQQTEQQTEQQAEYRYEVSVTKHGGTLHISPHRKCQYARGVRSSMRGPKRKVEPFMELRFPDLDAARQWWMSQERPPKNYHPCWVCFEWAEHGPNPNHVR